MIVTLVSISGVRDWLDGFIAGNKDEANGKADLPVSENPDALAMAVLLLAKMPRQQKDDNQRNRTAQNILGSLCGLASKIEDADDLDQLKALIQAAVLYFTEQDRNGEMDNLLINEIQCYESHEHAGMVLRELAGELKLEVKELA